MSAAGQSQGANSAPFWGQRSGRIYFGRKLGGPMSAAGQSQGANSAPFGGSAAAASILAASMGVQ